MIKIKRIYEAPDKADGFRVLIDRLWPRGLSKAEAKIDLWLKEIAPSNELRKWFGHEPQKCAEFKEKYFAELKAKQELAAKIKAAEKDKTVTLLYAAKDERCNNAAVLKDYIDKMKEP